MQSAAGETRPSRKVTVLFPDHASRPDPDVIDAPKWLGKLAKGIWATKVERYRRRGQKIAGFEHALAQYCALEAEIVAERRKGNPVPSARLNAHRIWAAEFYDTPASQGARPGSAGPGDNRFSQFARGES